MARIHVACCGAYCKTCRPFRDGHCRGCRLGYEDGSRDIGKAKCRIKICCMTEMRHTTCADCSNFDGCEIVQSWYAKAAGKHRRYRASAEFIREHGYDAFIAIADGWTYAGGRLE